MGDRHVSKGERPRRWITWTTPGKSLTESMVKWLMLTAAVEETVRTPWPASPTRIASDVAPTMDRSLPSCEEPRAHAGDDKPVA